MEALSIYTLLLMVLGESEEGWTEARGSVCVLRRNAIH
jgi:hypothetical protein